MSMPYREPGKIDDAKTSRPGTPLVIARHGVPAFFVIAATVVITLFASWLAYGTVHLECRRAMAGATPTCTGGQSGTNAKTIGPFELTVNGVTVVDHPNGDGTSYAIWTPAGELTSAVDEAFADKTVADARRFLATPTDLRFESRRTDAGLAIGLLFAGGVVLVVVIFMTQKTRLVLDAEGRAIVLENGVRWSFDDFEVARAEGIEDSPFYALVLMGKDEKLVATLAKGREADVKAAAAAINDALPPRERGL